MSVAINTSPTGALNEGNFNKRRASEDESELHRDNKRSRFSWYYMLEEESSEQSDDDSESIYTAQEYETEIVRDTSDTSTHTWVSDCDIEDDMLEYEVDSASDSQQMFDDVSSASEPEENIFELQYFVYPESENLSVMADDDSDDSRSSMDSVTPPSSFKTCIKCKKPNDTSLYQYCKKCFQERKAATYFRRPKRKPRPANKSSNVSDKTTASSSSKSQDLAHMDSGIGQSELGSMMESGKELSLQSSGNASFANDSQANESPNTLESPQTTEEFFSQSSDLMFSSQGSELLLSASQDSGVAMSASQSSELLLSASQDKELPLSASQGSELPLSASQDSELPLTESQSSESTLPASQDSGVAMSSSQSSESTISQSREGLLLHSRSNQISSCQTTMSISTSLVSSQEITDEVDSGDVLKDRQSSLDSLCGEKQTNEGDAQLTIKTLLQKLQKIEKESNASSMLCITCFESKRDSVFIHGKTGHQCCCYKCAKKVCLSNNNRCPMCKRRVSSITKIFLD